MTEPITNQFDTQILNCIGEFLTESGIPNTKQRDNILSVELPGWCWVVITVSHGTVRAEHRQCIEFEIANPQSFEQLVAFIKENHACPS